MILRAITMKTVQRDTLKNAKLNQDGTLKKFKYAKENKKKKTEEPEKINNKVADLRANIQYFL